MFIYNLSHDSNEILIAKIDINVLFRAILCMKQILLAFVPIKPIWLDKKNYTLNLIDVKVTTDQHATI